MPRRASLGRMVDQSTMLLMVSIGSLILLLALMILFHENANATKGYKLRTLEQERTQYLLEEEVLKMHIAQEQSLELLQQDGKVKGMIVAKNVRYVGDQPQVAKLPME